MRASKSDLPGLSVVITCFNLEHYIEDSLASVLQQNYPGEHEIIIVDDCSSDRSVEIIKRIIARLGDDKHVTLICNEKNLGVAGATDVGWKAAKYEWILEVDGDDIQMHDRCSKTADLIMRHPQAGLIVMSHSLINAAGQEYGKRLFVKGGEDGEYVASAPEERVAIYMGCGIAHPVNRGAYGCSMCVSKKLIEKWGALSRESTERFAQDPPWELRAFLSFPIVWSNQLACKYRSHESNILNKMREGKTVKDFIQNEMDACEYAGKDFLALEQMQRDLMRVKRDASLSDWGAADVENCLREIQRYAYAAYERHRWWSYSLFKRMYLSLRIADKVPSEFKSWFKLRIVPCSVAMFFKWLKKKR
ncbi:MAG: glycosyltransferase family 2 protein [Akkermansia sp.]|nr:glycosyltransferase family 2 protein [Akkermansia sp.]